MLNLYIIILMNNEIQFKIVRGKGSYGKDDSVKQLNDVLSLSKESGQCTELRILHCPRLSILNGIQICKQLKNLNLSCNAIEDLTPLKSLLDLQTLDVKTNRIRSLKGIQNLRRLVKLDASHNKLETLDGLGEGNSRIQNLILYDNSIKNLSEIDRLKIFKELKEVCFLRGGGSNPFCQNMQQYYGTLQVALQQSKSSIKKIDDLSSQQLVKLFQKAVVVESNNENSINQTNNDHYHHNSDHSQNYEPIRSQNIFAQSHSHNFPSNNQLFSMTQRQADLQRLINTKDEIIEQLRRKQAQLQLTSTNQFRDSIRKQAEFERVTGQVSELSRNIDLKDQKINELHRRIEELLKVNTASNGVADKRSQELDNLRKQFGDLKIENAQLKVLNKDQENRLRQLQNKALLNIEDKSQRLEELRTRNEQIMRENYELQHHQQQYKDRIRQLTQLLKEWQTKYQHTVRELQSIHNIQKEEIFSEFEAKTQQANRKFEDAQRSLNHEWQEKMNALESQYSSALEGAIEKYNRLKRAYDDKSATEAEVKTLLKSVMAKNTQNQNTIKDYEQALIKTKKTIITLSSQHELLIKQHQQLKIRSEGEIRALKMELLKTHSSREKLERQVKELRISNQYLQKNYDNLNSRQKEYEQLLDKCESLQNDLDAKNVMLDDKVQTINKLKQDIEIIQKDQEGRVDVKEYEKLEKKYRRQKGFVNELSQKNEEIKQQNEELREQINELKEKCQINAYVEQEFSEVKEIMKKQELQIKEKDQLTYELGESLEKLKNYSKNLLQEINTLKNEKNKLLQSIDDKESKWNRLLREKQSQYERKLTVIQEQTNKYKSKIAQQFSSFAKTLTS